MRNHHFDFILNYRLLPHNKRLLLKSRPFFTFLVIWGTMQITTEAESRCLIFIKFQEFPKQHLNSSSIVNCDVKLKRDRLSFYVARRRHEDGVEISVDLRAAQETQGSLASAVTVRLLQRPRLACTMHKTRSSQVIEKSQHQDV